MLSQALVPASNVLGVAVAVRVRHADSARVRYGPAGSPQDSVTPAVPVSSDSALVPVLGLLPDTRYALQVSADGACGTTPSAPLELLTGSLPADLPAYAAGGTSPSPGFVIFAAGSYGLAIDNTGRVVWYHRFPGGAGLNFQAQPTGRYVARPPAPPGTPASWVEIDPLGRVTRTLECARGLLSRFHDLIVEPDGSYWMMCDETRIMDLSALGGVAAARVLGTIVQRIGPQGTLLFEWSAFDHFELTDLPLADRIGTDVNWTHGNAIDLDADGNLLVSFRSLGEITKIDTPTGAVIWRMGGLRNQFQFENSGAPAFRGQHGLRVTRDGQFQLLDNLGDPAGSAAERFHLDEAARTARRGGEYRASPAVFALLGGTTQELPGGRMLVSYGNGGRVEEYDAVGNVVWRIEGSAGYVFRAQRIASLYQPGTGLPR